MPVLNLDTHILIHALSGDAADELIAATSVVHQVPLLTRDRSILQSRLVPLT